MNESLFQFIWQYSLYNSGQLQTSKGDPITIVSPGRRNTHAGPDFENAKIRIGNTLWVGDIELHLRNSDWLRHKHDTDPAYQRIILHVVYINDMPDLVLPCPVIELQKHIPASIPARYTQWKKDLHPIPCMSQLRQVNPLILEGWQHRMLAERWEDKLNEWKLLLGKTAGDWHTIFYYWLAEGFGCKVNAYAFRLLAQSLPLSILARHKDNLLQLEALLFGQAGMLNRKFIDLYPIRLQREYFFLQKKYSLPPQILPHLWRYLRLRPANFPCIRIAQFAGLIHRSQFLFSKIIELHTVTELIELLETKASAYWNNHCRFERIQNRTTIKKLGPNSLRHLLINVIAPAKFLYAWEYGKPSDQEKALGLLASLPPEKNHILSLWSEAGWEANNAQQSQALLQLHNQYCVHKRCLECAIGLHLLKVNASER
jgi:hypothetical protein